MKTLIHGKMYNLVNFKHPGGNIPIQLIDNKDGTCLFESYHPVSDRKYIEKILSKYEIENDNSILEQNVYDFSEFSNNNFTKELRLEVYNYFKKISNDKKITMIEATKSTPLKYFELFILGLLFIINLRYMYIGYYFSIITTPFFYWLFFVNIFHDISHFSHCNNKIIELLINGCIYNIYSSIGWYNHHIYSHHCHTNILNLDNDINQYFIRNKKSNYNITYKIFIKLFYTFFSAKETELINWNILNLTLVTLNIIVKLLYFKFFFVDKLTKGLIYALTFYLIPQLLLLVLFYTFTQVNHIHSANFVADSNFYYHQIITATNIKTDSYIMRILSGGLNYQIEHHLFPSVNSCHLPEISKIVKKLCKKYNIKYNEYDSFFKALYDVFVTIKKIK
jgi:fatty acid desaturase